MCHGKHAFVSSNRNCLFNEIYNEISVKLSSKSHISLLSNLLNANLIAMLIPSFQLIQWMCLCTKTKISKHEYFSIHMTRGAINAFAHFKTTLIFITLTNRQDTLRGLCVHLHID